MILTCPACGKRYRVPAEAIPAEGKLVRCAACRHGWVAMPEDEALLLEEEVAPPVSRPLPVAPIRPAAAAPSTVDAEVAPVPTAPTEAAVAGDTGWSAYEDDPPRRRVWPWVLLAGVLLAAAAVAAWVFTPRTMLDDYGIPPLDLSRIEAPHLSMPHVTIGIPRLNLALVPVVGPSLDRWIDPPAPPPSPLRLEVSGERRRLANGTRLLVLTGRVVNPTASAQAVPAIAAALVAPDGRAYRWRIDAPVATLPAGHAAPFESVTANWPEEAQRLDLGFAAKR